MGRPHDGAMSETKSFTDLGGWPAESEMDPPCRLATPITDGPPFESAHPALSVHPALKALVRPGGVAAAGVWIAACRQFSWKAIIFDSDGFVALALERGGRR